MKTLLFSLLALLPAFAPSLRAQTTPTPIPTWAQSYGTGGYNGAGQPVYDTSFAPGSGYDAPVGIAPMPDGGVVVAGQLGLNKFIPAGTNRGRTCGALVRYNRSGQILWQQLLRQNNDADGTASASKVENVRTDGAGNIFVSGWKLNSSDQILTAFVAKFSSDGALIWQSGFNQLATPGFPTGAIVGAEYSGGPVTMDLLPDGGVILGTDITYNSGGNNLVDAPFLAKINADGSAGFQREFETSYQGSGVIKILCRRPDADGYALVLYKIENGNGVNVVILTDATGNPVGQRIFRSSSYGDNPLFLTQSSDGGFLLLSALASNNGDGVEVRKLNADFTPVWRKLVRHFSGAPTLTATGNGGCLLVGQITSSSDDRGSSSDVLLVSLDGSGNVSAAHDLGGFGDEGVTGDYRAGTSPVACVTADGGLAFSVSTFSYPTAPGAMSDWWIVKADSAGKVAGYSDNMFDLPATFFGELDSDESPSFAPASPFGSGTVRNIPLTIEPQLVPEDLETEVGINKPVIKNQTTTPIPPPVHGGLSGITFAVDESDQAVPVGTDPVLRFRSVQSGTPAGLTVRVQSSTNGGATWNNIGDATGGLMSYVPAQSAFVLNSTSYPATTGVYFRSIAKGPGYGERASSAVGPFDLTPSKLHFGGPLLFVTTNGEVNPIRFGVKQADRPAGVTVRIQTSQTPADEASWKNATSVGSNSGYMTQDSADPNQFYVGNDEYPDSEGVYFRAVASASGYVDSLSFAYGPFKFIKDPPATVTITVNGANTTPNDIDGGYLLPSGTFNMRASAVSGRFVKRLTLLYDGNVVGHFDDGATTGALDYTTNIPGDHIIEAYATDDLGVTGAAAPIHVRIFPAAPGKAYTMITSGNWSDAGNWIDSQGNHGVPGPNDFAIVSTFSPTFAADVTVNAMSLNGGTLNGAHTLTVTGFCTIADGVVKSNLTIPSGATCELLNDTDLTLTGELTYAGTLRLHGKGGIGGMHTAASLATFAGAEPDGFFDFVGGIINGVGKLIADLASGGRRGSKATPATPAVAAPETRTIAAAAINISAGTVATIPAPSKLISQDGGGIVSHDSGGLISQDGGGLVASGAGNLVAQGAGNLVAQGAGNLVAQGAGNLVAQGAGNLTASGGAHLVATGAGNLVAQGAGNLVAQGAGNRPVLKVIKTDAAEATSGISVTGGELNLSGLTVYGDLSLDGGVLTGSGVVVGDLTNTGGYICPGHSAGAIAVTGAFAQDANGTLIIENGGPGPDRFDQLLVSGAASLGGKLDVKLINGYTPDPADTFNPLGYASADGRFANVSSNAQATMNADGLVITTNPALPGPKYGQPLNISTRMEVLSGENVLIGGFIVTGPSGSTKKIMVRGLGPSLAGAGLSGLLADPLLELHRPDGSTLTNDNWADLSNKNEIPNGFQPQAKESVIIADLAPGNYTVIERGAHGETGVGLTEVYDMNDTAAAQLGNISTRGFVGTLDKVLIGGFIIGGNEPGVILMRAIGPSLAAAGITGALADPILELHDANGGVFINDDWRETQEGEIKATTIPPANDREPALLATLAPGNYTVIVRGKDGGTGVALVEAYNVK